MSVCMPNHFSWVQLFVTLWTIAHQGFSRKDTVLQGIFPTPEMEAECLMSPLLTGRLFTTRATQEDQTPDGGSLIF